MILKSLSLCCKRLQEVAQPFIFHIIEETAKLDPLLLALVNRPDLASQARWVNLNRKFDTTLSEDMKYINQGVLYLSMNQLDSTLATPSQRQEFLLDLFLSLVPNVEELTIFLEPTRTSEGYHSRRNMPSLLEQSYHLNMLQKLRVESVADNGVELDNPALHKILTAAPRLEELMMQYCTTRGCALGSEDPNVINIDLLRPTLGNLQQLDIYWCDAADTVGSMDYLQRWMALCSSLQLLHFDIWEKYGTRFSTLRTIQALHPLGQTLKELHFPWTSPIKTFCQVDSFEPFACVEQLCLSEFMLCPWPDDDTNCANSLAKILPPSVKRLQLETSTHDCSVWDHARDLGHYLRNIEPQSYNLKRLKINVKYWNPRDEEQNRNNYACAAAGWAVKQAFQGSKVVVSICFDHDRLLYNNSGAYILEIDYAGNNDDFSEALDDMMFEYSTDEGEIHSSSNDEEEDSS